MIRPTEDNKMSKMLKGHECRSFFFVCDGPVYNVLYEQQTTRTQLGTRQVRWMQLSQDIFI